MTVSSMLFLSLFYLFVISNASCYLPVICVPGVADTTFNLLRVCNEIERLHPGTKGIFVQPGGALFSFYGMWGQIDVYRPIINAIFKQYPDGVHVLAHSQGTLLMRAIIESTPNHPVKNFLSVAGPFMGQFGISFVNDNLFGLVNFNNLTRDEVYTIAYNNVSQKTISVAGYWNDPHKQDLFMNVSTFLPYISNLKDHPNAEAYKTNYLLLNNTILFGGPDDEVIIPWQSEHAGFYDENLNIVQMKDQYIFTSDAFGLRTQYERGGLTTVTIPGAKHNDFVFYMSYTQNYFINYLY